MYSLVCIFPEKNTGFSHLFFYSFRYNNITQLTESDTYNCGTPSASPNGKMLAFTSNRDGNYHLFYFEVQNSKKWFIISNKGSNSHPTWSSDNKRLAYVSTKTGKNEIFIFDIITKKEFSISQKFPSAGQPNWHPKSDKIAFCGIEKTPPVFDGRTDLYIYDIKQKNYEIITPADDTILERQPNWSKRGDVIYYSASNLEYSGGMAIAKDSHIYYYDMRSKKTTPVTKGNIFYSYPTTTYRKNRILFLRHDSGFTFTILYWNTKTGNYTELTFGNKDQSPCFGLYAR